MTTYDIRRSYCKCVKKYKKYFEKWDELPLNEKVKILRDMEFECEWILHYAKFLENKYK